MVGENEVELVALLAIGFIIGVAWWVSKGEDE
jgi:hypothetical protein